MINEKINDIEKQQIDIKKQQTDIKNKLMYIEEKLLFLEEKVNLIIAKEEVNNIEREQLINRIFLLEEKIYKF